MTNLNTKVFAMYLPQYHCIPENDEFWGKGFTDWVTVTKAKPLFKDHVQPRIPLNNNYYDLSKEENVIWQAQLAAKYGISGFGVYHYWFNNEKNILTRPAEILRDSKDIKIKYFFSWDNANWKRSWSNVKGNDWAPIADNIDHERKGPEILIPYILGDESDWKKHYNYVYKHFQSPNYEKYNNMPLFSIIIYSEDIIKMCECWNKWAIEDGFSGICFIFQNVPHEANLPKNSFIYDYEPHYIGWMHPSFKSYLKNFPNRAFNKFLKIIGLPKKRNIAYYKYDNIWSDLLKYAKRNKRKNVIHGAFVGYDDSPRRGQNGSKIIKGGTPKKFETYFNEYYNSICKQNKPYIFLTAWNEWGEGAYLEPDIHNGLEYLTAIKNIIGKKLD